MSTAEEGLASDIQPQKDWESHHQHVRVKKDERKDWRLILEADTAHGMDAMFILIHTRDSPWPCTCTRLGATQYSIWDAT